MSMLMRMVGAYEAPFAPTGLSGLLVWLDASDASTLFQDAAGTTPATADSDPVGRWADKSGNANHYTQGTAASRPTLRLAVQNGEDVLRFDGSNDLLEGPDLAIANGDYTLFAVRKSSATGVLYSCGTTTNDISFLALYHLSSGNSNFNHRSNAGTEVGGGNFDVAAANGAFHAVCARRNGTGFYQRVNATTGTSTTTLGTTTTNNSRVGCYERLSGPISMFNGDIAEVLVYSDNLSDTDVGSVMAYLKAKWGTP